MGASPTRQPLQPEAIGAVMEVTKWLKPSISVSRIGDSASVQAVTRVTNGHHQTGPVGSVGAKNRQSVDHGGRAGDRKLKEP